MLKYIWDKIIQVWKNKKSYKWDCLKVFKKSYKKGIRVKIKDEGNLLGIVRFMGIIEYWLYLLTAYDEGYKNTKISLAVLLGFLLNETISRIPTGYFLLTIVPTLIVLLLFNERYFRIVLVKNPNKNSLKTYTDEPFYREGHDVFLVSRKWSNEIKVWYFQANTKLEQKKRKTLKPGEVLIQIR